MEKKNTKEFTCPFCSLLCDDINVVSTNNKYRVVNLKNKQCLKKIESYNIDKNSYLLPKIFRKTSTLTNAINNSKKLIKKANEIGILNLGSDMSAIRSLINLSSQINASVDHVNSRFFFTNMNIIQRSGYMATSLMEVKNRSDVILIFGNKIMEKSARLFERAIFPNSSLFVKKNKKKVFLIGEFPERELKLLKNKPQITNIKLKLDLIPQLLKAIDPHKDINESRISKKIINKLQLAIKNSAYATAIWSTSDFSKADSSDFIINSISQFICNLNIRNRAACLPISGNLGDATSSQVTTWLTGFPTRIKGVDGFFKHDREAYDVSNLINNNEVDLAIYLNCLSLEKIQINKKIKNIVIGHPKTTFSSPPDIFIPVGIPGVDFQGVMYRTDNIISLLLKSIRELNLLTPKQVLDQLA